MFHPVIPFTFPSFKRCLNTDVLAQTVSAAKVLVTINIVEQGVTKNTFAYLVPAVLASLNALATVTARKEKSLVITHATPHTFHNVVARFPHTKKLARTARSAFFAREKDRFATRVLPHPPSPPHQQVQAY
jgi:hypothetical protein